MRRAEIGPGPGPRRAISKRDSSGHRRDDLLIFGSPVIGDEEIQEAVDSIRAGWPGTGPRVAQFERDFASFKGMPYAAAVSSCTAGLHLACLSLNPRPGDEIITTALTFCA